MWVDWQTRSRKSRTSLLAGSAPGELRRRRDPLPPGPVTYIPDFTDMTVPGGPVRVELWIGWLGSEVELPGATDPVTLDALLAAKTWTQIPDGEMGAHTCEICGRADGHGRFYVDDFNCRYILPNLVIHYMTEHAYKLPEEVEQALLEKRTYESFG